MYRTHDRRLVDLLLSAWLRAALEGSVAERDRQFEALVHWLEAAARDDTWSVRAGA